MEELGLENALWLWIGSLLFLYVENVNFIPSANFFSHLWEASASNTLCLCSEIGLPRDVGRWCSAFVGNTFLFLTFHHYMICHFLYWRGILAALCLLISCSLKIESQWTHSRLTVPGNWAREGLSRCVSGHLLSKSNYVHCSNHVGPGILLPVSGWCFHFVEKTSPLKSKIKRILKSIASGEVAFKFSPLHSALACTFLWNTNRQGR